ncbi:helix-turn-helix transcriptional regulator [Streptomyces sp. NEAU-H3]|uniref:helix-turn-helix domain-containing protein n=1 Tax=Streptomyces sp. NEAU-H3 TaxID=2720636 RepID=UPI00143A873B|nr:helix-turn-helix transcriptional regulator [Streptomyces sp. NEAU-H3]NJA55026.1 helix-turn-helix transcriptional regulator [Streptomyces sp. NEAU-H3]
MVNRRKLNPEAGPRAAFGARLRTLREQRGWTQPELGARMGYAPSHISGVEIGSRNATAKFAARADKVFGTGEALTRQGDALRNPAILDGFDDYLALEREAVEIRVFELNIMPGLVQTQRYAEAIQSGVMARGAVTAQQAEERLARLAGRQAILAREDPPKIFVVIDEGALHHWVGGANTMSDQYGHLLDFAGLPHTVVQVAPFSLGERRSLYFPVYLLKLRTGAFVAYTESAQQGRLERESRYVEPLLTAYHHLQVEAMPQAESAALIDLVRKGKP